MHCHNIMCRIYNKKHILVSFKYFLRFYVNIVKKKIGNSTQSEPF